MAERRPLVLLSGVPVELPTGDTLPGALPAATQAEMEAGTEAGLRSMSPLRVKQAVAALAPASHAHAIDDINGLSAALDDLETIALAGL